MCYFELTSIVKLRGTRENVSAAKDRLNAYIDSQFKVEEIDVKKTLVFRILFFRPEFKHKLDQIGTQNKVRITKQTVGGEEEENENKNENSGKRNQQRKSKKKQYKITISGKANNITTAKQAIENLLQSIETKIVEENVSLNQEDFDILQSKRTERFNIANKYCVQIKIFEKSITRPIKSVKKRLLWGQEIEIKQGDITKERADAIVNSANDELRHNGGVAFAISKAAGPQLQEYCNKYISQHGRLPVGEVRIRERQKMKRLLILFLVLYQMN
jgi:hypothetical protein